MANLKTRRMVMAALLAALTTAATMVIRIPTPTLGYIHLGDGMVLICGILLGPGLGAVAAGIGSMLADLFGGCSGGSAGRCALQHGTGPDRRCGVRGAVTGAQPCESPSGI